MSACAADRELAGPVATVSVHSWTISSSTARAPASAEPGAPTVKSAMAAASRKCKATEGNRDTMSRRSRPLRMADTAWPGSPATKDASATHQRAASATPWVRSAKRHSVSISVSNVSAAER